MADAHRIVEAQETSGRHVFVDMFGRFDPSDEFLQGAIREGKYGTLETIHTATRSARLWEGYSLRLDSIAMDVMHSSLDKIVRALGSPASLTAIGTERESAGSAAEVLLTYPGAIAVCNASSLKPIPYGVRGGYRAVFTGGVLESTWTAGYEGSGPTVLTEYTEEGVCQIDLPESQGYAVVVDHVFACLEGRETSRIAPDSVLDTLQLTIDVHNALTGQRRDFAVARHQPNAS
jgi:predicted dehydrogenase